MGRLLFLGLVLAPTFTVAQTKVDVLVRTTSSNITLTAELYRPTTDAPRAAVIVMHGCGGLGSTHRTWGEVLARWGYVAAVLDSFGGRGVKEVCTGKQNVDARDRAWDVAGAAHWLKTQSFVKPDRIALQGHSHGAAAVLFAALAEEGDRAPPPAPAFRAVTAFYPDCTLRGRTSKSFRAQVPIEILVGEADDWTPAGKCRELLPRVSGGPVELTTYPGAYHSFDGTTIKPRYRDDVRNRNKPGGCCGAWIGFDEPAYRDSLKRVEAFLQKTLGGPL